ncbi:nickel-dependent lactate racemase [Planktothrix sp. FACHB-1355]|uniref:nickel-dependent lactate racemase n=1 Tax=Planktothrix sp. FACHB-1355 TaxID=2692854 RepID=UPI00168AC01E|nr:nickel-dependent lactate racemase [Planktothrix sp. FACHB-1355]MBD3557359.1 nickel-dependent lactate racemase [Planktothrix sp. FACHB-1355]
MKINESLDLKYGKGTIKFGFERDKFEILEPVRVRERKLSDAEILKSMADPIESEELANIVKPGEKILIAVPDATRLVGSTRICRLVADLLGKNGIAKNDVKFLIGGGIHRKPTPREIEWVLGREISENYEVQCHDAVDESRLAEICVTSRGTRVKVNAELLKADQVIQIGGIGFHYIAGFSGGRKVILPGCAGESTIQQNHKLAFDRNTLEKTVGIESGNLENNPVHADMIEAVSFLQPSFAINTVINQRNELTKIYCGHWKNSHLEGCREYYEKNICDFKAKRGMTIVSAGGFPRDANLTQSHKAMEHAAGTLKENGAMIVLAECVDGLGRRDFLDWFVPGGSDGTAKKLLENYKVYGQTVWGIRWKTEKFRVFLISEIEPKLVERMGMIPSRTIEEAIEKFGAQTDGYIIPRGLTTLPQLQKKATVGN